MEGASLIERSASEDFQQKRAVRHCKWRTLSIALHVSTIVYSSTSLNGLKIIVNSTANELVHFLLSNNLYKCLHIYKINASVISVFCIIYLQ